MRMVIYGDFPGLNEFIDANRISKGRWNKGNNMKQLDQKYIVSQLPKWHTNNPVYIKYHYFCKNRKKDPDNVAGYFHKIFLDALVQKGIIPDDGWKYIIGFSDYFDVDSRYPRIEVDILEG